MLVMILSVTGYVADLSAGLSVEQHNRASVLYEIVRCPVCNGQSLAGSESEIAQDLRHIINTKINNNLSDEQIKNDLVEMYGQEILFEPPFNQKTFLLNYGVWIVMSVVMLVFLYRYYNNRKALQGHNANPQNND